MGGAGTGLGYPSAVSSSSNLVKRHARPSLQQGMQSTSTSRISDVLEPRTPVRSTRLGAGAATTTKDGSNPKTTKKSPRKHHHLQQTRRAAAPPSAETSTTTTTTTATLAAGKGKQPAQEAEEEEDHPAPTNPNPSYDPTEENEIPSPESVIGPSVLEDARDGAAAAAERPGTAIHSPAAFDGGRRVGEE
ncbi:hypothetical protein KC352_g6466 [Hortaea werneckii]|nr:hypothetical protein KC348_g18439 [Hortaea werneckii]KAI7281385.1 hypothetical protein KC352_g6466 [Hortaea werneckii]